MNKIKLLTIFSIGILILGSLASCTDDGYFNDGGTSSPFYEGSTLEYLKSRPDYFNKLVNIVEYTGMEKTFEEDEITFFAPTDFSINKSIQLLNSQLYLQGKDTVKLIEQIDPQVWKDFLTLYIIEGKYLLKDIPQMDTTAMNVFSGQGYKSLNGRPMNMGVVYHDLEGVKYAGYRELFYSYIYDFAENDLINAHVATSDIQSFNGAVHVIRFRDHYFGFNPYNFPSRAISSGIKRVDEIVNKQN